MQPRFQASISPASVGKRFSHPSPSQSSYLIEGEGSQLVQTAGLPSPLLEINYNSRLSKSVDLLENKRPRLWPIYGRTLDLCFIT